MTNSRSQKETNERHEERMSLAKRIAQALPERNVALRTESEMEFIPEQPAPTTNTAVNRLGSLAIHFANKQLREAGITGVSLTPSSLTVLDSTNGSRMNIIRKANISLKATFPSSDGLRVATKGFTVNMSYGNGVYAMENLKVGSNLVPVTKDVLRLAQTAENEAEDKNPQSENKPKSVNAQVDDEDEDGVQFLSSLEQCPLCGSKPGEGATRGCKGCDPVLIHGPEYKEVAQYNDKRQAQKKNSSPKDEDIGKVETPLADFYKGSSAKVATRFLKSQRDEQSEPGESWTHPLHKKEHPDEYAPRGKRFPSAGVTEKFQAPDNRGDEDEGSNESWHGAQFAPLSNGGPGPFPSKSKDEVPDYSNSGTNGWDSHSDNDLSQQDGPPEPKQQDLQGWDLQDHTFTTGGPDPTEMGQFRLTKDGRKVDIEEFFGDYKINDEFIGDSKAASAKLQELTGLTLDNIYEQIQYEESQQGEDPMGGPGRYI